MKVLIAVDDQECSSVAFEQVLDQCWSSDTTFRVVSVVPILLMESPLEIGSIGTLVQAEQEIEKSAKKLVDTKVRELQSMLGEERVTGCVLQGPVTSMILDLAEQWGADLIVLGSHNRKGIEKLMLGSVAEFIFRHAKCSVEIVRDKSKVSNDAA